MAKNKALSLRVQWLGERLRKAREAAGYRLEDAGEYLQIRHATLSRFENGIYRPKPSYVRDLIDFYGVSDERERAILLQLNEDAWRKDLWNSGERGFDTSFIDYTWLESRATKLCVYEPLLIHGLLQTPAYAEAVIRTGQGIQAHENTVLVTLEARLDRQHILQRGKPTQLSAIFEEGALRRRIGDAQTHVAQLRHLLTFVNSDHIEVLMLEANSGWHAGLDGAFTFIDLPDPYPDVVYTENLIGQTFLEEERKVDSYRRAYDGMRKQALSRRDTAKLIKDILKDLE